jgi:drug/metabolite transporter (DMT)-like permease
MTARKEENILIEGGFILLVASSYTCMRVLAKLGKNIPDRQLVFMRNFVCLLLLLPRILPSKPKLLQTKAAIYIVRAIAGRLNMCCFFYSIHYIILTDAILLNNTMPLFVPLVLFYYFAIGSLVSAILLFWSWRSHISLTWLILIGIGIFSGVYRFSLTKGYRYAPKRKISFLIYFAVILSGVFDWAFWNIVPDRISLGLF